MKKPLPSGLRGRVIRNLPYTKSDVSPNREVARSLQDILQQVKQREASFKPGDPVGQPAPPVPQAPTSVVSALATRFKNLWDPDATLERRKYLIKKFHRSHFQDMVDIKNHGQKAFAASSKMIPAQKALYMPNLYAKSLDGRQRNLTTVLKDKVSLVSFEFTKLGGNNVDTFAKPFHAKYGSSYPMVQHIRLNIVENILKGAIVRACVPWLAQQVPAEQRGNYLTYFWPIERIKDDLFIQNLALGWVFLVDRDLKVRWYANGIATPKELEQLYAYVAHLQPGAKSPVTE